jgi:hypothetical protein
MLREGVGKADRGRGDHGRRRRAKWGLVMSLDLTAPFKWGRDIGLSVCV